MHYVIAFTYGLTIWLAAVAYSCIAAPDRASLVILAGPVIISALMVFILALDWLIELALSALVRLWNRLVGIRHHM